MDPGDGLEVTILWGYQRLRAIHHQRTPAAGKPVAADVSVTLHTWPIPEVARPGWTLRSWGPRSWPTSTPTALTNRGTGAITLIVEKPRRLAHGSRTSTDYRLPTAHPPCRLRQPPSEAHA